LASIFYTNTNQQTDFRYLLSLYLKKRFSLFFDMKTKELPWTAGERVRLAGPVLAVLAGPGTSRVGRAA
jgi:hypothetical protein